MNVMRGGSGLTWRATRPLAVSNTSTVGKARPLVGSGIQHGSMPTSVAGLVRGPRAKSSVVAPPGRRRTSWRATMLPAMSWNMSSPPHGKGDWPPTSCSQHTTLRRIVWSALTLTMPKPGGSGCGLKAPALPETAARATAHDAAILCIFIGNLLDGDERPATSMGDAWHDAASEDKDAIDARKGSSEALWPRRPEREDRVRRARKRSS